MRLRTSLLAMALLMLFSCGNNTGSEEQDKQEEKDGSQSSEMQYSVTPFPASPEYREAVMEDMSYQNGTFSFDFSNYELGIQTPDAGSKMCANSAKGQHIHLIANTQPYAAYYTSAFQHDLPNGEHYLLAFLSRSYHESIKNGQAYIAKQVNIQDKTLQEASDISEPMLFYSRPKGTYVGAEQTDKVMLDFFLLNAELGDSYKVKAVINDEEHILDGWQPYFIEGLPMGENMITLTLIDAEGNKVDTPLNPVTRKFTLKAAPAEEANQY